MITKEVEATSPYVNGIIIELGGERLSLDRYHSPAEFFNEEAGGHYHVTVEGDQLDQLAQRYYGDFKYWHIIVAANRKEVPDFMEPLPSGISLFIPNKSQFDNL